MPTPWEKLAQQIDEAIIKNKINAKPKELYQPINYTLSMGGKRIRPTLALMATELFGKPAKEAMHIALAIEVFHNFTLVHDDIMDEAPLRRGKETVHKKWGRDIAILAGDVMMVKAYQFLAKEKGEKLSEMLQLFNQTAIEVCEGQQLDMNFEVKSDTSLSEYLKMIELKTAVLLAASLKLGALSAGANEEEANLLYDFGKNTGIAFQIQDDYLDVYADEKMFGKQIGGDILNNKKTYLLLRAIEEASPQQQKEIERIVAIQDQKTQKIDQMVAIYNQLNIPQLTKNAMQHHFDLALTSINKIKQNKKSKEALISLAKLLLKREH